MIVQFPEPPKRRLAAARLDLTARLPAQFDAPAHAPRRGALRAQAL